MRSGISQKMGDKLLDALYFASSDPLMIPVFYRILTNLQTAPAPLVVCFRQLVKWLSNLTFAFNNLGSLFLLSGSLCESSGDGIRHRRTYPADRHCSIICQDPFMGIRISDFLISSSDIVFYLQR